MQELTPEQSARLKRDKLTPKELATLQHSRWEIKDVFVDAVHEAIDKLQRHFPRISVFEITIILHTEALRVMQGIEWRVPKWLEMKAALAASAAMDPLQFLDPKAEGKEEEA